LLATDAVLHPRWYRLQAFVEIKYLGGANGKTQTTTLAPVGIHGNRKFFWQTIHLPPRRSAPASLPWTIMPPREARHKAYLYLYIEYCITNHNLSASKDNSFMYLRRAEPNQPGAQGNDVTRQPVRPRVPPFQTCCNEASRWGSLVLGPGSTERGAPLIWGRT